MSPNRQGGRQWTRSLDRQARARIRKYAKACMKLLKIPENRLGRVYMADLEEHTDAMVALSPSQTFDLKVDRRFFWGAGEDQIKSTVAHEVVHVALHPIFCEIRQKFSEGLPTDVLREEERLCDILGNLLTKTVDDV